jgi:hypothetical protein
MGKLNNCVNGSAFQIFVACLIPNLGSWVMFIVLWDKIKERETEEKVKSALEPPEWVRTAKTIVC